ncbi:glycosyltransferase family 4 protein [Demequina sp. SO4-13]|uniref:glycosyltransferase family 4 protein n=1 Tax=Demequina sp. SO4-13 TaxID=3401027 RepID=UPI003AF917EF
MEPRGYSQQECRITAHMAGVGCAGRGLAGREMSAAPISVHFVEPGGQGGVFQHTAEVARLIVEDGGRAVLHTSADREPLEFGDIVVCGCVKWYRDTTPRALRYFQIVFGYLFLTLPHLSAETKGRIVHLHGLFKSPLYAMTLWLLRLRAERVVFSPHNTFSRAGRRWEARTLQWAMRRTDIAVCYSNFDAEHVRPWGVEAVVCPLVMWMPETTLDDIAEWRTRLSEGSSSVIILMAGQIRADKGIDQMILAAPLITVPFKFAVVGEDKGHLEYCREIANRTGVEVVWMNEYFTTSEIASAIAAADVVVLPYSQASQSAVAVLANAVGTPTVAYPVGGVPELATVTTSQANPRALAEGIMRVITTQDWCIREPVEGLGPYEGVYGS